MGDMTKELASEGWDVTVLAPHPTLPFGKHPRRWAWRAERREAGVRVVNLWTWQPQAVSPRFLSRISYYLLFPLNVILWMLAHRKEFDVVLATIPPGYTVIPGRFARRFLRKLLVVDERDLWINNAVELGVVRKGSLGERVSRRLERKALEKAALVTCATAHLGEDLHAYFGTDPAKIVVVPNGVDTRRFAPSATSPPRERRIVYAGNVGWLQDLENVVLAMEKVGPRTGAKLLIVGEGDTRDALQRMAKENGIEAYVEFRPPVSCDEIPAILHGSMLGVAPLKDLPGLAYAAPTKAYEYMGAGLPFLGVGRGEVARLASESGAGAVAGNDPEEIAAVMIALFEDEARREAMSRAGLAYAQAHCDRVASARKLGAAIVAAWRSAHKAAGAREVEASALQQA